MWKLIGDGSLDLSEARGDIIPEFGTNGKDVVTVEHVLTHTSGFRRRRLAIRRCSIVLLGLKHSGSGGLHQFPVLVWSIT